MRSISIKMTIPSSLANCQEEHTSQANILKTKGHKAALIAGRFVFGMNYALTSLAVERCTALIVAAHTPGRFRVKSPFLSAEHLGIGLFSLHRKSKTFGLGVTC